ncbi:MAG: hypothetical protein C4333_00950 [Meiothermus sp.]
MDFQAPQLLLLLLVLPILVWEYRRRIVKATSSAYVLFPAPKQFTSLPRSAWKRHLGAGLYLLALALGVVALARPQASVLMPDNLAGVVLTIDISLSMRATDIEPSRLEAAKTAAQTFVKALPPGAKVALVSFAGYASTVVPLTTDHARVLEQIDSLELARRTAIGEGLRESLSQFPLDEAGKPLGPSTVVLLSDGRNNWGVEPFEVVEEAKAMGVVVHTIGLGRRQSEEDWISNNWMAFDEETLRAIAEATGGEYYAAESAQALMDAYRKLGKAVGWKPTRTEVSGLLTFLAGLTLASSLVVSNLRRKVV